MACAALECTTYEIRDTIIIITMQSYAKKIAHILVFGTFACAAYSWRCSLITAQVVAVVPIMFALDYCITIVCICILLCFTSRLLQGPLVVSWYLLKPMVLVTTDCPGKPQVYVAVVAIDNLPVHIGNWLQFTLVLLVKVLGLTKLGIVAIRYSI